MHCNQSVYLNTQRKSHAISGICGNYIFFDFNFYNCFCVSEWNLSAQYWKSVIVIDVFLKYFKHYCISVSTPLNATGIQYCRLSFSFQPHPTCWTIGSILGTPWTESQHSCQVYPKWLGPPHLDFTSLDRKMLHLDLENSSRQSLAQKRNVADAAARARWE